MKFIVLGLGNFGKVLAVNLTQLGHEVIGVDSDMEKVEHVKEDITHAVCLDCTDKGAMKALPLKEAEAVIVAIGENEGASMLTVALLKQLKIKRIIGRVVSELQRTIIDAMQITEYVLPEADSAERLALRLDNSGIVDSFKISERYSIVETEVPEKYVGKTVAETRIEEEFEIKVITTIKILTTTAEGASKKMKRSGGIATPETVLKSDELLVLFGELKSIHRFINKNN